MLDWVGEPNAAALFGLISGILLGLAARIGRFCTLGAIEDYLYGGDDKRLRMWGVAIGVAIIGTSVANSLGAFDSQASLYLSTIWNPWATVIGGLLFGYGMALSGNCGYGVLARFGGGDLRAFVILIVMGLSAYVFLSGPLAETRVWLFPVVPNDDASQGFTKLASTFGIPEIASGLVIGGAILCFACLSQQFAKNPTMIFWGATVGAAILTGWLGTYWIAQTGFGNEPIETHSFTVPIGDTIFYGMTASGNTLSFSVGSVMGVILGAMIGSFFQGHFRWEACEDPRELKRQIFGAALMGPGAVLALGCSVGQGISAFSVLSFSAPVTFLAIFVGAALGLRQLITGFSPAE